MYRKAAPATALKLLLLQGGRARQLWSHSYLSSHPDARPGDWDEMILEHILHWQGTSCTTRRTGEVAPMAVVTRLHIARLGVYTFWIAELTIGGKYQHQSGMDQRMVHNGITPTSLPEATSVQLMPLNSSVSTTERQKHGSLLYTRPWENPPCTPGERVLNSSISYEVYLTVTRKI